MAEGLLRFTDRNLEIYSAGTKPAKNVNPYSIKVMKELNIDISTHYPKSIDNFLSNEFDYVITVCDNAKESCPVFTGQVKHRLHIGFDDPAEAVGTEEEVLNTYRRVRDEIKRDFNDFYNQYIRK